MKKIGICVTGFLLICFQSLYSQIELEKGLLFSDFTEGRAVLKNNKGITAGLFNYNTIDEEMLFKDVDNTVLALANPSEFFIINVDNRLFEHAQGDAFYERISLENDNCLYVQWKSKIISEGKSTAYGGRSQASSITNISSLKGTGGTYNNLTSGESFKTKVESSYYLKIKNRFRKFSSAKTLGKLFKEHATEIEELALKEKIDFNVLSDVVRIVEYGFQLTK